MGDSGGLDLVRSLLRRVRFCAAKRTDLGTHAIDRLLVMRPHPQNFHHVRIFDNLIHQAMLDVDPP
jgi:hypothetical protein